MASRVEELFQAYRAAAATAHDSGLLHDCIQAGHAWAAFIKSFEESDDGVTVGRIASQDAIEIYRDEEGLLRIVQFQTALEAGDFPPDPATIRIALDNVPRLLREIERVTRSGSIDSLGRCL